MTRRRKLDPLEISPGALQAFAADLTRITASGDWLQMLEAAKASPWFAPLPRCACCGMPETKYFGAAPANPIDHALYAIGVLRDIAARAAADMSEDE